MDNESLNQIIGMHIKECDGRDSRNVKTFDEIKSMFKSIFDQQGKTNERITGMQIKASFAMGIIFAADKLIDFSIQYFQMIHK